MWKSKRRKYLEALLEGIRDRQHDLLYKCDMQEQQIAQLQNIVLQQENFLNQCIAEVKQCSENNKTELYDRICAVENNLNYYSMIRSIMTENKYINLELLPSILQNNNSKKILICGFFGADNLGDELMLQTVLDYIPKEKHSSVTVMLCDNEEYNYYHLPGVNFIHMPKNKFDCNILAQNFDLLIWGGGALIDDSDYSKDILSLNNLVINLSKRFLAFDKSVVALGLSTNKTFSDDNFIKDLGYICERSKYFSLRDENSLALLNSLGITNISLMDDLVFYNKAFNKEIFQKSTNEIPIIGIIWICYEDTVELFKNTVNWLINNFNGKCKIKCIPFYDYVNLDSRYYFDIIKDFENVIDISVSPYSNDIEKVISEIAETDYMVNMRYHGMLLSGMLNKKSLNICYDTHRHYFNKIDYLTKFFGINNELLFFSELNSDFNNSQINFATPKYEKNKFSKQEELISEILNSEL